MIGNGTTVTCKAKGSLRLRVQIKEDRELIILLKEVIFVPGLKMSLFSLSGVTEDGGTEVKIEVEIFIEGIKVVFPGILRNQRSSLLIGTLCGNPKGISIYCMIEVECDTLCFVKKI